MGKTSLSRGLSLKNSFISLDGDKMRTTISRDAGFSKEDRHNHNIRVALLAKELESQGFDIVVSVIAPFRETREEINKMICPIWIYLYRKSIKSTAKRPYQIPTNAYLKLDTGEHSIKDCVDLVTEALGWEK